MQKILFIAIALLSTLSMNAQDASTWTLERCIDFAQKNSLNIKQGENTIRNAELTVKLNELSRYPTVNGSITTGANFGTSINRASNTFATGSSAFNSLSLSANGPIYNGGRIQNSILQSRLERDAAKSDQEQTIQNTALSVASNYLQVLLAQEQLSNTQKRLEQNKQQLSQVDKFIQAGSRPQNDRLDILAQLARNEQLVVAAQNNVELSYLALKQSIQLDPATDMKLGKPTVNVPNSNDVEGITLTSLYNSAVSRQPQIKAGEYRQKAAELGVKIAQSDRLPSISWFSSISTNYSTLVPNDGSVQAIPLTRQVYINGSPNPTTITSLEQVFIPGVGKKSYFSQVGKNLGEGVGVSINIPIYNQGRNDIGIERAHINILNTQLSNQQTQNRLKSDIQTAIANARAAKKTFEAAEKTIVATKAAFENIEKKFKVGAASTFEFTTAKNNWDTSETDLIVAKYDYIFKLKIVDFYQGKKLVLN